MNEIFEMKSYMWLVKVTSNLLQGFFQTFKREKVQVKMLFYMLSIVIFVFEMMQFFSHYNGEKFKFLNSHPS